MLVLAALAVAVAACQPSDAAPARPSLAEQRALGDSIKLVIERAYDFGPGDNVGRLMSLYPDSGPVVSVVNGRVTTRRDSLQADISSFWQNVGQNMRGPKWVWGATYVDALSRDAVVFTGTYTIPHRTPAGAPHVVGGAWTALFVRRGGRWVIAQEHLSSAPIAAAAPADSAAAAGHQH